jgi:hypothetical protein
MTPSGIGLEAAAGAASRLAGLRPGALFVDAPVSGSRGPGRGGTVVA